MDRFVFKKLTFIQLLDVADHELTTLNKDYVLRLCTSEIEANTNNMLLGFGFLGIRFVSFLEFSDVNQIFPVFIVAIEETLVNMATLFCNILSMTIKIFSDNQQIPRSD